MRDALIRRQHASTLLLRHRLGIALGIDRDGSGPHNPTERTLFLSYISDYSAARERAFASAFDQPEISEAKSNGGHRK